MSIKKTVQRLGFRTGESIVYPAHGVGVITAIETVSGRVAWARRVSSLTQNRTASTDPCACSASTLRAPCAAAVCFSSANECATSSADAVPPRPCQPQKLLAS